MEDWRLIAFGTFIIVVVAIGAMFLQRRQRAQKTGDDPIYGVASLDPERTEQTRKTPRPRGVGTTSE